MPPPNTAPVMPDTRHSEGVDDGAQTHSPELADMQPRTMELDEARIYIREHYPVSRAFGYDPKPRLKILCPLHSEKSPSLQVDDEAGLWFCFGCKEGGDVFTALMRTQHLTFREAVVRLAEDLGIQVTLTQGERTVHDRRTGEGLQNGKPVHFILSHSLRPAGTLEYALDAIQLPRGGPWLGLVAGPQRWDEQTWIHAARSLPWPDELPEHITRTVRAGLLMPWPAGSWSARRSALSPTPEQRQGGQALWNRLAAGCDAGHPVLTLIGGDGEQQQQMLDEWTIGALLLIAPPREHKEALEQLPPALRAGTPVFAGTWSQLQGPVLHPDVTDEQFWAVSQALGYTGRTCAELTQLLSRQQPPPVHDPEQICSGLRRLRRRSRDRDLFHPGPMRQQALISLLTGLDMPAVRRLIWQNDLHPAAVANLLGKRTRSAEDALLASAIWALRPQRPHWNRQALNTDRWPISLAALNGARPVLMPLPEEALQVVSRLCPELLRP